MDCGIKPLDFRDRIPNNPTVGTFLRAAGLEEVGRREGGREGYISITTPTTLRCRRRRDYQHFCMINELFVFYRCVCVSMYVCM